MSDPTTVVRAEIDRVGARIAELKAQRESLQKTRAAIRAKIDEIGARPAAGSQKQLDETLAQLRIEDEQTAEHERQIDHQLAESEKVLDELAKNLEMIQDSSIV